MSRGMGSVGAEEANYPGPAATKRGAGWVEACDQWQQ